MFCAELERSEGRQPGAQTTEPGRQEPHRPGWLHPSPLTSDLEIDPKGGFFALRALSNLGGGEGGEVARQAG